MKSFLKPILASMLTIALVFATISAQAQDKPKKTETGKPAKPAAPATPATPTTSTTPATPATPAAPALHNRALPYGGTVSAVDKSAKTITIKKKEAEKIFFVTSSTKIKKAGKPATLEDAIVGDEAGISYTDGEGGKAEAGSIRLGPKPEKTEAADNNAGKAKKEKKPKKEKKNNAPAETKPADQQ